VWHQFSHNDCLDSLYKSSLVFFACDYGFQNSLYLSCMMQVWIVGHMPPGVMGRSRNVLWMRPPFNQRFVDLLRQYHKVILAAIFGHEHTDGFRVVYVNGKSRHNLLICVLFLSTCKMFVPFLCLHHLVGGLA